MPAKQTSPRASRSMFAKWYREAAAENGCLRSLLEHAEARVRTQERILCILVFSLGASIAYALFFA